MTPDDLTQLYTAALSATQHALVITGWAGIGLGVVGLAIKMLFATTEDA